MSAAPTDAMAGEEIPKATSRPQGLRLTCLRSWCRSRGARRTLRASTAASGSASSCSRTWRPPRHPSSRGRRTSPRQLPQVRHHLAQGARLRDAQPATYSPSDSGHPLRHRNPHDCVNFLESMPVPESMALPSPRLLATHLPYSLLPSRITECGRIVYVCREPKDALVSFWIYNGRIATELRRAVGMRSPSPAPTFEEAFELFCKGQSISGPQWRHTLEYWEESRSRPGKVLFLKYEEMLQDPAGKVRSLAAFMGCPFSRGEEEAGVVQEIVQLCSFEKLRSSEVNKNCRSSAMMGIKNDVYFRKGAVGDWRNYMTPEMAARLDKIVDEALQGSGFTFGSCSNPIST